MDSTSPKDNSNELTCIAQKNSRIFFREMFITNFFVSVLYNVFNNRKQFQKLVFLSTYTKHSKVDKKEHWLFYTTICTSSRSQEETQYETVHKAALNAKTVSIQTPHATLSS